MGLSGSVLYVGHTVQSIPGGGSRSLTRPEHDFARALGGARRADMAACYTKKITTSFKISTVLLIPAQQTVVHRQLLGNAYPLNSRPAAERRQSAFLPRESRALDRRLLCFEVDFALVELENLETCLSTGGHPRETRREGSGKGGCVPFADSVDRPAAPCVASCRPSSRSGTP